QRTRSPRSNSRLYGQRSIGRRTNRIGLSLSETRKKPSRESILYGALPAKVIPYDECFGLREAEIRELLFQVRSEPSLYLKRIEEPLGVCGIILVSYPKISYS